MADLAPGRAANPQLRALADRISAAQKPEIDVLRRWLQDRKLPETDPAHDHATMPGMQTGGRSWRALTAATGADFDRRFVAMMTAHHQGAQQMAGDVIRGGTDERAVRDGQRDGRRAGQRDPPDGTDRHQPMTQPGREVRADPEALVRLARTTLTSADTMMRSWSTAQGTVLPGSSAYGNSPGAAALASSAAAAEAGNDAAWGRITGVYEGDVDRLYRVAFAYRQADAAAAERQRRARGGRGPI